MPRFVLCTAFPFHLWLRTIYFLNGMSDISVNNFHHSDLSASTSCDRLDRVSEATRAFSTNVGILSK